MCLYGTAYVTVEVRLINKIQTVAANNAFITLINL